MLLSVTTAWVHAARRLVQQYISKRCCLENWGYFVYVISQKWRATQWKKITGQCSSTEMKATCKNWANLEQGTKTTKIVTYPLFPPASSFMESLSGESGVNLLRVTSCYWNWREDTGLMDYWGLSADLMCHVSKTYPQISVKCCIIPAWVTEWTILPVNVNNQEKNNNATLNKIMSINIRLNTYSQTVIHFIFICHFHGSQSANLDNQYIFCGKNPNMQLWWNLY